MPFRPGGPLQGAFSSGGLTGGRLYTTMRSSLYEEGVDGWILHPNGNAEFNNVTVRGTLIAGTSSSIDWSYLANVSVTNADIVSLAVSKLTAGTITAQEIQLSNSTSSIIRTSNFVAGSAGWRIRGNGDAEFNDVVIRGDLKSDNFVATTAGVPGTGWRLLQTGEVQMDEATLTHFTIEDSYARVVGNQGGLLWTPYKEGFPGTTITDFVGPFLLAQSFEVSQGISWIRLAGGRSITGTTREAFLELGYDFSGSGTDPWEPTASEYGYAYLSTWFGGGVVRIGSADRTVIGGGTGGEAWVHLAHGTAALPSLRFSGDTDTGMYRPGANVLALVAGGAQGLRISSAGVRTSDDTGGPRLTLSSWTAGAPAYTFSGDTNTGMYRSAADQVALTTGGTIRALAGNTGLHTNPNAGITNRSGLYVGRLFLDVGNVEVLRANRTADSGIATTEVGYYSSWERDRITGELAKDDILSLEDSPLWNREWFKRLRPVSFRRVSTNAHELGFIMEDMEEVDDNMKYLTTNGDTWGGHPHELAMVAALVLETQDLQRRVDLLEQRKGCVCKS